MSSDERGRGLGLAQRLRASIDAKAEAHRQAEDARKNRLQQARKARATLLRDLAAFGRALGHAKVTSTDEVVTIRLDGRGLRFEAVGEADEVRVQGDGLPEGYRILHSAELDRWGLHPPRGAPRLLFDAGLEELVARAFELRPVQEAPEPAVGEQSSPTRTPGSGRSL